MSESASPQTPICRIDPCEHALLKEQVRRLTAEGGLMEQVIRHVKESNALAKHTNKYLRVAIGLFIFSLILILLVLGLVWRTFSDVAGVEKRLNDASSSINGNSRRLSAAEDTLRDIKTNTDKAAEDRDSRPRIDLVPEQDPDKARAAPIRVRITPPASPPESSGSSPVPTQSAVEVPLPVKDVVRVLPDSGARG